MDLIKVMKLVAIFSALAIGYVVFVRIDYADLSWAVNRSGYIMLVSGVCTMVALISTIKQHSKSASNQD